MKKKKITLTILAVVALLTVGSVGTTMALLSDKPNGIVNVIGMGGVDTDIIEEGEGTVKKSKIANAGDNDCLVRVRVTVSPAEAAKAIELTGKDSAWDWSDWDNGDGFVYYKEILPAKEETPYLFEGVALKEETDWKTLGIDTFDITVYEESVQTTGYTSVSVYDENGKCLKGDEFVTAVKSIFATYNQ